MDLKFDLSVCRDSSHMTPLIFLEKGAWTLNCWALNAFSKTAKAADFRFDVHVLRDSPDMTPKNTRGCGQGHVTP